MKSVAAVFPPFTYRLNVVGSLLRDATSVPPRTGDVDEGGGRRRRLPSAARGKRRQQEGEEGPYHS